MARRGALQAKRMAGAAASPVARAKDETVTA
jgi:hypothetical protein